MTPAAAPGSTRRAPLRFLLAEHAIQPGDIAKVEVFHAHYRIQTPLREGGAEADGRAPAPWFVTDPASHLDTQLSTPWAVAMTLLGVPGPQWQRPETLTSPEARALARKVAIRLDPDALKVYWDQLSTPGICRLARFPVTVVVTMNDGRRLEARTEIADGDPWDPSSVLSDDVIREKLIDFGCDFVPRDRLERAADALFALETVPDVRSVTELLTVVDRTVSAPTRP